jgi:hypothetical protein
MSDGCIKCHVHLTNIVRISLIDEDILNIRPTSFAWIMTTTLYRISFRFKIRGELGRDDVAHADSVRTYTEMFTGISLGPEFRVVDIEYLPGWFEIVITIIGVLANYKSLKESVAELKKDLTNALNFIFATDIPEIPVIKDTYELEEYTLSNKYSSESDNEESKMGDLKSDNKDLKSGNEEGKYYG